MTARGRAGEVWTAWAGFAAGPVCWFAQQELALLLVPASCGGRPWITPLLGALFGVVLAVAAFLSWRCARALPAAGDRAGFSERRTRFIAVLGSVSPLFFLAAIAWQGIAGFVYSGCER
jgi:hypothetical protein